MSDDRHPVLDIEADTVVEARAKYGIECSCLGNKDMACDDERAGKPCLVNAMKWPELYRGFERPTTGANPAWEAMQAKEEPDAEPEVEHNAWVFSHGDAEVTVYDLHVDGDDDCDHSFTPWDISSGAEANPDDEETAVIGFIRMESHCEWCPARVGRQSVAHLNPGGARK